MDAQSTGSVCRIESLLSELYCKGTAFFRIIQMNLILLLKFPISDNNLLNDYNFATVRIPE